MSKTSFYSGSAVTPNQTNAIQSSVDASAASEAAALASQNSAAIDAATAATKAAEASASASNSETSNAASATSKSASQTAAFNAASSASSASTSASTATTKAADAATSSTESTASASTATTKASEAATSAADSETSRLAAAASLSSAASSASSITALVSTATTKAAEAATSATSAATSETAAETAETNAETAQSAAETAATNASTSASTATTKASEAATSASTATTKASEASTNATNAATSASSVSSAASTATTKASEASTSATNAATSASTATTKASEAATSATNAATSASTGTTKASEASTSATNAATSASTATTKASEAATSATNAATSASTATASKDAALAALDSFDDRYLGQKSSNPTVDNDGDALVAGSLVFNTSDDIMYVFEGTNWVAAYASVSGAALQSNNLSDLDSAVTSRTNLGVAIGSDVQAYSTVLNATTAPYTSALNTKLSAIEASADVTDTANVVAALTAGSNITIAADGTVAGSAAYSLPTSSSSTLGGVKVGANLSIDGSGVLSSTDTNTTYSVGDGGLTQVNFTTADNTKLDGIEASATANQTGAEIKTAYEAETNAFTDAQFTKLAGIEASADVTDTANVTASGALMDSEVTNLTQVKAFNSADYATAAQGTTADASLPKAGGAVTGAITTNSTFDGRDVATDGTKLDGIESNATANQTGAEIKAAYEAETNAFTDAQFTKLAGIETSADVTDTTNVTAAGALMDSELNSIADVKAIDQSLVTTASPTFAGITVDGGTIKLDGNYPVGTQNVALGDTALDSIGTGNNNTAIGHNAGTAITTGYRTTTVGSLALESHTTGHNTVAIGYNALNDSNGNYCVAVGSQALNISTGDYNVGMGYGALEHTTTGRVNTAIGHMAGAYNYLGDFNVSIGNETGYGGGSATYGASYNCFMGSFAGNYSAHGKDYNVGIGYQVMNDYNSDYSVGIGFDAVSDGGHYSSVGIGRDSLGRSSTSYAQYNTCVGTFTGNDIYTGDFNVALGYNTDVIGANVSHAVTMGSYARGIQHGVVIGSNAGESGTDSSLYCILVGYQAGYDMDGGDNCTYVGRRAGYSGGTGSDNVALGSTALHNITTGYNNTALGSRSLNIVTDGFDNTACGRSAGQYLTTGDNNTFLGRDAGNAQDNSSAPALTTGSNVMCLGHEAVSSSATVSNEITLGDNDITSLRCNVQTISSLSDIRDKTGIEDLPYGLDFINDMRPVKFTWNRRDGSLGARPDMGFIAQELADVEATHSSASRTRLVNWENPAKLEADYARSYPILVKALQELSTKCDALEARLATLEGA